MRLKPQTSELIFVTISGSILLLCYHRLFSSFFPAANGHVGEDYSYILPHLLDGYYWQINNGAWAPQWFSPAFCGGLPAFPNPQDIYYSLPQWFTLITDPLHASYYTMLTFATLGFAGFYLLLRLSFNMSIPVALLGATLFMFNGFYSTRLLIGHVTFHAFMLTPMIAFMLLSAGGRASNGFDSRRLLSLAITALLLSYAVYSSMLHLILPVILILVFIGTLHGIIHADSGRFWLNLVIAGGLGIVLALPKLAPAIIFTYNFERSYYLLPGANGFTGLLKLVLESLFLQPSAATVKEILVNQQWRLGRHEFEYGITFIPLLIILLSAALLLAYPAKLRQSLKCQATTCLQIVLLVLILALPLAVNFYTPDWNAMLKTLPVIKDSSNLLRWFCVYIPVTILIAMLMLEKAVPVRLLVYIASIAIVAVIGINAGTDRHYYSAQDYDPNRIVKAYKQAKKSRHAVTIRNVATYTDKQGNPVTPTFRNDTLILGASQLLCYEAVFGYGLELFPRGSLHAGPISRVRDGRFNLKNPACYIFGKVNHCQPGDHFLLAQKNEMEAFADYRPYNFVMPVWQLIINWVSLCLLLCISIYCLLYPLISNMSFRGSKRKG